jgi:NTP pyrophosphatase (non-canonical NTP hydrolase)
MTLSDLQQAVDQFDRDRGWHKVDPAHIGLHLLEELGEIARELLRRAAYKGGEGDIAGEMSDLLILLAKLANRLSVKLEPSVRAKLEEIEVRFPAEEGKAALERYAAPNPEVGGED